MMALEPATDAPAARAADSGISAGVWIGGLAAVAALVGGMILVRRRRSEHYAA